MFKVQVTNDLPKIIDKLDMININIQSAVAEAVGSSQSEVKSLFDTSYFQETEIEISPSVDGITMDIKNLDEDYYYYQNTTGSLYSDIGLKIKQVLTNRIKNQLGIKI